MRDYDGYVDWGEWEECYRTDFVRAAYSLWGASVNTLRRIIRLEEKMKGTVVHLRVQHWEYRVLPA